MEHIREYWRSVHAGRMLTHVLPAELLVSVGVAALARILFPRQRGAADG